MNFNENARHDPYYLAVFPRKPTLFHPDVQLKLEHDRSMRRNGYIDYRPVRVPVSMLETCKKGSVSRYEIGYLRLNQESIDIVRQRSGYTFNINRELNSYPPVKTEALNPRQSVTRSKVECNNETPVCCEEQAASVFFSSWRWRILAHLAEHLHASFPSDIDPFLSIMHDLASNTNGGLHDDMSLDGFIDNATSADLARYTTVPAILQSHLFGRPFMVQNPACSLPRAFFNELKYHASRASVFPGVKPPAPVKLELWYDATVNLPSTDSLSGQNRDVCVEQTMKTQAILSINLLSQGQIAGQEDEVEESSETRINATGSHQRLRFVLYQGREGLHPELSKVILSEKSWNKAARTYGPRNDWWEGHL